MELAVSKVRAESQLSVWNIQILALMFEFYNSIFFCFFFLIVFAAL